MSERIDLNKAFLNYFNESEGFSLRSERFYDDVRSILTNPALSSASRNKLMRGWLEAAFIQGARTMAQDTLDTLGDYATAVAGIDEKVYNRSEAFDAAKDNLMVYFTQILQDSET